MYPTTIFERWTDGRWVPMGRSGTPDQERELLAAQANLESSAVHVRRLSPSIYDSAPPRVVYQTAQR